MTPTDIAIFDGTLSDAESLAELHKRKDIFLADRELMPDLQSRGLATFNTAIDTDIPLAMSSGQPVVSFMKKVLITIGALYKEQEQRDLDVDAKSTGGESDSNQDTSVPEHRVDPGLDTNGSTANTKQNTEHIDLDEDQLPPSRLDAAIAARKKRKLLTHGSRRKGEMVPPVAKIDTTDMLRHMDNVANGSSTTNEPPLTRRRAANSKHHQQPSLATNQARGVGSKQAPTKQTSMKHSTERDARTSLIVKLKVPRQFLALHQVDGMTSSKPRRKRRGKYKSAEFVASDTEASDTEMCDTPFNELNSKKRKRSSSSSTTHTRSTTRHSGRKRTTNPTTPPMQPGSTRGNVPKNASPNSKSWETISTASATSHVSNSSPTSSSIPSSPSPSPSRSPPPPPVPAPSSSSHLPHTFPTPPKMPRKSLPPFHRGALIALENVLEDYLHLLQSQELSIPYLNVKSMLREVIDELEENKPSVCDWERRTVLKGGAWVFGVLRGFVGEGEGEGEDGGEEDGGDVKGKGKGKGKGKVTGKGKGKGKEKAKEVEMEMDMDVEGVVRAFKEWVESEFARLGGGDR